MKESLFTIAINKVKANLAYCASIDGAKVFSFPLNAAAKEIVAKLESVFGSGSVVIADYKGGVILALDESVAKAFKTKTVYVANRLGDGDSFPFADFQAKRRR